jgi:hypothetical protein
MKEPISFPMARNSDPETSHLAAETHQQKLSKRREQVLFLVWANNGLTAAELARVLVEENIKDKGNSLHSLVETPHKRLPELEKLDLVIKSSEPRKCTESGYLAHTWWLTGKGQRMITNTLNRQVTHVFN